MMIDRDQLTEALDGWPDNEWPARERLKVVRQAARLLLDFPTDEMVVAAQLQIRDNGYLETKAVLEAVRRVMFGEDEMPDGRPWMDEGEREVVEG